MKYDPNMRYTLMFVYDMENGPDECDTHANLTTDQVIAKIKECDVPEQYVFIADFKTGKLCGLKYEVAQ